MEIVKISHLFLFPKFQGAIIVEDLRPMSLSNFVYLIIAKVIVDQPWEVIGVLVGHFQSSFILEDYCWIS